MCQNLREWFIEVIFAKGFDGKSNVDGRNLYAYRITADQYQALRQELKDCVLSDFTKTPLFCGAVVLYASEWWRREYQGGPWKWEPILTPIGLNNLLSLNQRTELIQKGLAYWKLPPATGGGKAYFGAIVAQGGLPLFAIQAGAGANLGRVMVSVLKQAGRYHWSEQQIADAIGFQGDNFAQSLRNEDFYALVAQMIGAALRLKRECRLEGVPNPLELLDTNHPDWKNEFPIALDDAAAVHLLNGLVEEVNRTEIANAKTTFTVERSLRLLGDNIYKLQSTIICPPIIVGAELAAFAGLANSNHLPGHFTIDAAVGAREELTHARSALGAQEMTFKLAPQRRLWIGETACEEHLLHLRGHAGDLLNKPIAIPGGNAISFSEPWVFTPDGDGWLLAATGDVRLRDGETVVAVNEDWNVSAENGELLDFGTLDFENTKRRLVCLSSSGSVRVKSTDDTWIIHAGVTGQASAKYFLEGDRVPLQTSPYPLFRGMPHVVYYDDEGQKHKISQRDMRLSRPGSNAGITNQGASPGLVHLSIEKDGNRLGRLRFGIIEKTSREIYRSGDTPSQGYIDLSGWGTFTFNCQAVNVAMRVNTDSAGNQKIHLEADDKPPGYIPVSFNWSGSRLALKTWLPFPAAGGCAYDEQDRPIESGKTLPLGRLLGKRILVFANPDHTAQYKLELTLSPSSTAQPRQIPVPLERNRAEIRLADYSREIESLLVFSDNLDACVAITLTAGGTPNFRLYISRYDTKPFWQEETVMLPEDFMTTLSPKQLARVKALAVSLIAPEEPLPLEQNVDENNIPTGIWSVNHLLKKDPWLIIPATDSSVSFRPTIVDRRGDTPFNGDGLCALACSMPWPDQALRASLIDSELEEMASNFNNPSWDFFARLWQAFKHLPLCSLDVFRRLALRPDLAVSVLFAPQENFYELSRRLRHELGLILELVPVAIWRKTVALLCNYYKKLLKETADSVLPAILDNKFKALTQELPNHRLLLDMLWVEAGGEASEYFQEVQQAQKQSPDSFGKRLWQGDDSLVQHYLLRVHANDRWPEPLSFKDHVLPKLSQQLDQPQNTQAKEILSQKMEYLFWHDRFNFRLPVVNIPAVCALWTACNFDGKWWRDPSRMYALRILRAFDPVWFDECYQATLASCFTFGLLKIKATS